MLPSSTRRDTISASPWYLSACTSSELIISGMSIIRPCMKRLLLRVVRRQQPVVGAPAKVDVVPGARRPADAADPQELLAAIDERRALANPRRYARFLEQVLQRARVACSRRLDALTAFREADVPRLARRRGCLQPAAAVRQDQLLAAAPVQIDGVGRGGQSTHQEQHPAEAADFRRAEPQQRLAIRPRTQHFAIEPL